MTYVQTAAAIAEPTAVPSFAQRVMFAIAAAISTCGTDACTATCEATTEKPPPRPRRMGMKAMTTLLRFSVERTYRPEGLDEGV
jgi:hypothetical protein